MISRLLLVLFAATLWGGAVQAAPIQDWRVCRGAPGPVLTDCRPLEGPIDPQGREVWLQADLGPLNGSEPTLRFLGAMSTEAWLNGVRLGANGRPAADPERETPGRYVAELPIPPGLWRPSGNTLVLRMSAHHVGVRLAKPVLAIWVGSDALKSRPGVLAITFAAMGALTAAAFGFGAVHAIRRTGSSRLLAALAAVAAAQALVESLRVLTPYPYPLHVWRLSAIWLLTAGFGLLLTAMFAGRFGPRWRGLLVVGVALSSLAGLAWPGFDEKTAWTLLAGIFGSGLAATVGVRARISGARPAALYLALFLTVALAAPAWLLDLSYFLFAAGLVLPLLVAEVIRIGREDRDREAALVQAVTRPEHLTIATGRGVQRVQLADIIAITGADDYVELRVKGGRRLLHAARLEALERDLPSGFVRAHRSAIVHLAHVSALEHEGGRWRLRMSEDPPIPVSRSRLAALRLALTDAAAPGHADAEHGEPHAAG